MMYVYIGQELITIILFLVQLKRRWSPGLKAESVLQVVPPTCRAKIHSPLCDVPTAVKPVARDDGSMLVANDCRI